jgi:YidC/Oxa1 family membrane protein insertase
MVQQQKIMLYVFPVIFAVTGINFPVGVLLYWFTTNVWTMGQQFYVIRNSPQPDTPAHAAMMERKAAKKKGFSSESEEVEQASEPEKQARQQPKKQPKRIRFCPSPLRCFT